MPIHPGYRQVAGNKNRYYEIGNPSHIITRHQARNLGAQRLGFQNQRAYGQHLGGQSTGERERNDAYYARKMNSNFGRQAMANARAKAQAEDRPFNEERFKAEVIAARDYRPKNGQPAGAPYNDFYEDYDLEPDDRDWHESE
jgi:hypothetical protein